MKYLIIKGNLFQEHLKGDFDMKNIEQILTSMEVAEMVEKEHKMLLRDLRRYTNQLNQCKIAPVDFFEESTYKDDKGEFRPCYRITKKGCEFIAHKLTGTKGTIFTARYINRFHEMEDIIKERQESGQPWFIRNLGEQGKIMLFRDFKTITGVELSGIYTAWKRPDKLVGGIHYNGWSWKYDKKKFKKKYGFDLGEEDCLFYLYICGIRKALRAIENDFEDRKKLTPEIKKMILDGVKSVEPKRTVRNSIESVGDQSIPTVCVPETTGKFKTDPVQITILLNQNGIYEVK